MEVRYFLSSDIDLPVVVKICEVSGLRKKDGFVQRLAQSGVAYSPSQELFVEVQVFANGTPLGLPVCTTYRCFAGDAGTSVWNEWLQLPVKYSALSPACRLVVTVYDATPPRPRLDDVLKNGSLLHASSDHSPDATQPRALAGVSVPFFQEKALVFGHYKTSLCMHKAGDGGIVSATPSGTPTLNQFERIQQRIQDFGHQQLPSVSWLDKLSVRQVERVQKACATIPSSSVKLELQFPDFQHTVVFHQKPCNAPCPDLNKIKDRLFLLHDPEMNRESPIEHKYHKLARSQTGKDLKPNLEERREIARIIHSPTKHLSADEKHILWKFRYSLTNDRHALTKFLRAVDWSDISETGQALELLKKWVAIDVADALELLSSRFKNEEVRNYGIKMLERSDDEEFACYLLQLVQALRFEEKQSSRLSRFLMKRVMSSFELANHFYWYVKASKDDEHYGPKYSHMQEAFMAQLSKTERGQSFLAELHKQEYLVQQLLNLVDLCKAQRGKVEKKVEYMRKLLSKRGELSALQRFSEPIRLPIRPELQASGIIAEKASMFKSALTPLNLSLRTVDGGVYKVIFKKGDDLRQDQMVIQMIHLMDRLLKRVNLDLKLTPYPVLSTSSCDGFVDFVPNSSTLAAVIKNGSIAQFFEEHHTSPDRRQRCLDVFVKSCAGYCVITYILGVGDRHLDNLMLTVDGRLFHIDFGYMFGDDPKPFPPPMKLCKEMVEAMGGSDHPLYKQFELYCCQSFNILRKSATLILNLLSLSLSDATPEQKEEMEKNIDRVEDNFRLDLSDEEAEQFFIALISNSVNALFPRITEHIHKWALYWR